MKDYDYEKLYKKAPEAVKELQSANPSDECIQNWVDDNFPELADSEFERIRKEIIHFLKVQSGQMTPELFFKSEDKWIPWLEKQKPAEFCEEDEKIRRVLIELVKCNERSGYKLLNNVPTSSMIDWLEKQGEQKVTYTAIVETGNGGINALVQGELSADKVEPKFKVGDWVVQENIGVYKVIEICESWYEVIDFEDNHYSISFDKEYMCHLWTIDDAKDGDVLAVNGNPFIYSYDECNNVKGNYCRIDENNELRTNLKFSFEGNCIIPATKEQRDLLFQKMREAGYGWYANKKELMKISRDKIYTYDIRKNTMEEHEILETDACKFHFFNHNGSRCSYDSRGATVQLLNYRNTDDEYVLVSVDKQSLGWIKESYEKVISDFRFKCVNAVLDTIKLWHST